MPEARISLLQSATGELSDDDILRLYAVTDRSVPWLRVNFVSSIDGAATSGGLSAGLGSAADRRVFDLLRRLCDVVVVGAGTVRAEGYGAMRLGTKDVGWREDNGLPGHPTFAIVSSSLSLDPESRIFTDAPVRPIIVTVEDAPTDRMQKLSRVADVLVAGKRAVDTALLRRGLVERGLAQMHSEGGPQLFADFVRDDAVDELCLTVRSILEGPGAPRIVAGPASESARAFDVAHVLSAEGTLLFRYVRQGGGLS